MASEKRARQSYGRWCAFATAQMIQCLSGPMAEAEISCRVRCLQRSFHWLDISSYDHP